MKTTGRIITLTALLALAGGAALAHGDRDDRRAGPGRDGARPDFATLDTDGDGSLTAADFEARFAARFSEMDTDGDGKASQEEMVAHAAAEAVKRAEARARERAAGHAARMIERLDTDKDGALSAEEMQAMGEGRRGRGGPERMLERLDTDKDGAVSEAEFDTAMQARGDGRGKGGARGHGQGRGHGHGHGHGEMHRN